MSAETGPFKAAILTVSDACARGSRENLSGARLRERLRGVGFDVVGDAILPDEPDQIQATLIAWCAACDVILTTGGTGFSPRDTTPEATLAVIERPAPGISELLRAAGLQNTPRAALSRGTAGMRGRTLIVNLPGSPRAVDEGLDVLLPLLPHALSLLLERPVDH